jgi:hypothetical protein
MFIYQRSNNPYSKQTWPKKSSATRTDCQVNRQFSIYQAARFASKDATKSLAISSPGLAAISNIKYQEICAINYLAQLTFPAMEYLGS